jgi:hypothetical protein
MFFYGYCLNDEAVCARVIYTFPDAPDATICDWMVPGTYEDWDATHR